MGPATDVVAIPRLLARAVPHGSVVPTSVEQDQRQYLQDVHVLNYICTGGSEGKTMEIVGKIAAKFYDEKFKDPNKKWENSAEFYVAVCEAVEYDLFLLCYSTI